MDAVQNFCLACGKRTIGDFCRDSCARQGARECPCGEVLRRKGLTESAYKFRKRLFCGGDCLNRNKSERMAAAWRDPVTTARIMRGLRLSLNEEYIQRSRKTMQENWRKSEFRESLKRRPRRFTAEQIHAIRADPRRASVVSREYGVTHQIVSKIRARLIYADLD